MARIEEWVVVAVPAATAYERWVRLEELPDYVWGLEEVRRHADPARTSWTVWVAGHPVSFDAELTEVTPGRRIAWRSVTGPRHEGSVSFVTLGDGRSTVVVEVAGDPAGAGAGPGALVAALRRGLREGLAGFKRSAEAAWRPDAEPRRVAA